MSSCFVAFESGWFQAEWGLVDANYWDGFIKSVSVVVGSEAGRRAFERNRDVLAPEFVKAVEDAIERREANRHIEHLATTA